MLIGKEGIDSGVLANETHKFVNDNEPIQNNTTTN